MSIVSGNNTSFSPNVSVSNSQIYGEVSPDHSKETIWEAANRYSDAFWASAYENMVTSKFAVTAYQNGEEIIEDISMMLKGEAKDPNFNPYNYIEGYEDYALEFKDCDTIGDVIRTKKRIDFENKNYSAMSSVPVGVNFTNNLLTGFLDPVNLIPVGGSIAKAQGFVKGVVAGSSVGGVTNAVNEFLIKEMSYNYSDEEYAQNVLIGTVFSGALGGIGGTLNKLSAKAQIDMYRKNAFSDDFQVKKGDYISDFNSKTVSQKLDDVEAGESTVGAAYVRDIETDIDFDNKAAKAIVDIDRNWNPVAHLTTSVSRKAREVSAKLFEIPYFTKNIQDAFNVESLNKETNTRLSFLNRNFADNYNKYYFDKEDVGIIEDVKLLNPFGSKVEGKMSQTEFFEAVRDNIVKGSHSDNKYIVSCANEFRKIANEQKKRINELHEKGLVDVKAVDDNWVPFMIDKDKVIADKDGFVTAVSQKMKAYSDTLKESGEVDNKYKEIESLEANNEKYDIENKELAPVIKELNRKKYYIQNDIRIKEGQLHELEIALDKEIRGVSNKKDRLFYLDKDIDVSVNMDFAKQIKRGLPSELKPKSLTEQLSESLLLIDDPNNLLGKDFGLSLQNYKGRKLDQHDVLTIDELGERLWQDGWYKELPYVDDVVVDLVDDFNGINKRYDQEGERYLRREYEIDQMRDVLSRLGYDYSRMSAEEINNVLSDIGNKGYLHKQYVNKARTSELSKATKEQQAKINKMEERFNYIKEELNRKKDELVTIDDQLQSNRRLRNINKEEMKKNKSRLNKLKRDIEWQDKLVRLQDEDFQQYALEMVDDVLGVRDVTVSLDGVRIDDRGSLLGRDFFTGDVSMLENYLVKDISKLLSPLRKEMVDLNLIEKFGSVGLKNEINNIVQEYDIIRSKLEKQRKLEPENSEAINKRIMKLDKEREKDLDFLTLSVDRMRGTEYAKRKYSKGLMQATEIMKLYNVSTSLGKVVFSSIPDISGTVMKTDVQSALPALKVLKNTFNANLAKKLSEVPELSHAISELHSNFRQLSFAEMASSNPFETSLMKKSRAYVDVYMHANLLSRWNTMIKSVAGMAYMNKIYSISGKLNEGKALTKSERGWANLYGFSDDELLSIFENMNRHGNTSGSQKYANSVMWENKELSRKFVLGINKIMDTAVVTPGAERARVFDDPILSTVFQFKQFIMSSTVRTLVPALQNARDYNTAVALMTSMTLGILSVVAKDALNGKDDRAAGDYITEGLSASGITGWTELPYSIVNAMTRGGFDRILFAATGGFMGQESMSKFESDRILLQQLGPSVGKINNLAGFIGDVSTGNISDSSMYKLKSLIPMQNTIYLDWVLRNVLIGWSDE